MALQRMQHAGAAPPTGLASNITAASTSVTVNDGAGYPDGSVGPFVIVIDPGGASEEKVLCSSRSSNTFTVATNGRGYDSTAATSHSTGSTNVAHVLAAVEVDDDNSHIYTTSRDDHTQYLRVDGSRAVTGDLTVDGGLTVSGGTISAAGIAVTEGAVTASTVTTTGNVTDGGTLGVTGAATLDSTLDVKGNTTLEGALDVTGASATLPATSVGSTLSVTGAATLDSTLGVTGAATLSGGATVDGTLNAQTVDASGVVSGQAFDASLTGVAGRLVGATIGGAPTSGTFDSGDMVIDLTGVVWICNAPGTPGTWAPASGFLGDATGPAAQTDFESSAAEAVTVTVNVVNGGKYKLEASWYGTQLTAGSNVVAYLGNVLGAARTVWVFTAGVNGVCGSSASTVYTASAAGSITFGLLLNTGNGSYQVPANACELIVTRVG